MSNVKPEILSIFNEAIELATESARDRYLDGACQGDAEARQRVQQLLRAHVDAGNFLDPDAPGDAPNVDETADERVDTVIGPYKIREQIAEGGMGVVYVAEQRHPVRRKVAIKIIKPGMATKNVVARFEAERQALAMMDHPNIARVFDGGETDTGQPYFVMELVQGIPITEYCDRQRLPTTERLSIFLDVCKAVQHAHQKGIIHRDLKPTNVLVAQIDGAAVPKVIDFGVAKAVSHKLTEQTLYTKFSEMIGTPVYMSPEQAEMGVIDVDTRCDVYSLGVLLYELLTGGPPFDRETLKNAGFDEMRRMIREDDPPRPSHRISTMDAKGRSTLAERQPTDTPRFQRKAWLELDWVVMKALEKDRGRRYQSASALAEDLQRYLAGDLVQACPPSTAYRLRKIAYRNKVALLTASLIAISMLIGTGVSAWQAVRATAAEQLANDQKETAERNLQVAIDALEQMLANVGNPELADVPKLQEIRNKILEDTISFYERFKSDSGSSPSVDYRAAKLYRELGKFAQATNPDSKEVITAYSAGLELAKALVLRHPKRNEFREIEAEIHMACADYWWLPKRMATKEDDARAMQHFAQAEQQYAYLSLANPGHEVYGALRGRVFARMCNFYRFQSPTDPRAAECASRAIELGYVSHRWMARLAEPNDPELAEEHWRKCLAGEGTMSNPFGSPSGQAWDKSQAARFFASRDPELSERLWHEAITQDYELVQHFPTNIGYQKRFDRQCLEYSKLLQEAEGRQQALREADTLVQSHPAFHVLRAKFLDGWGDADALLQMLNESIRRYPTQEDYYRVRADVFENRGELDAALADLNHVLGLNPSHPYAYKRRAILYSKLGNYQKSIDDFTKWFAQSGGVDSHKQYKRRAAAYFELGKYDDALGDLNHAIDQYPDYLTALTWISPAKVAACPDRGFRDGILELADRAVALNERSAASRTTRALLLLELGQFERAREDLKPIEDVDADAYYGAYQAALIALKLDERARYQELCQKLVDAVEQTDAGIALHFAAWTAALAPDAIDDYAPALQLAQQAVDAESDNKQYINGLGAVQFRAGQYAKALESFSAAAGSDESSNTSSAYIAYFRAMTQRHLNRSEDASESLAEAIELADEELSDATAPPAWNRKFTLHLLRQEAESLIGQADNAPIKER